MTKYQALYSAQDLQRFVSSPATCDSSTADSLQSLLGLNTALQKSNKASSVNTTRRTDSNTSAAKSAKTNRRADLSACENKNKGPDALKRHEKLALATNVINETLKSLTHTAKTTSYNDVAKKVATSERKGTPERPKQSPLQAISGNRNPVSTNSAKDGKQKSLGKRDKVNGEEAQASCALIAFEVLLRLQEDATEHVEVPLLQVEKGLSALIQKCIILRLHGVAIRAIKVLRDQIVRLTDAERFCNSITNKLVPSSRKASQADVEASVVELLDLGRLSKIAPLLPLAVTLQCQILRLLAAVRTVEMPRLLELLDPGNDISPTANILRQIDASSPASKEKAAHELETLAQLQLKIAEALGDGQKFPTVSARPSAVHVLRLQTAALRTRAAWWKLSNHVVDNCKDIWVPLGRFLDTFRDCAGCNEEEQYLVVREAFDAFEALVSYGKASDCAVPLAVYRKLAGFAQKSQNSEASSWLSALLDAPQGHMSPAFRCFQHCQAAKSQLREAAEDSEAPIETGLFKEAAKNLAADLQGSPEELEELFVIASSLRKSTCVYLTAKARNMSSSAEPVALEDQKSCVLLLVSIIRFYVRYLGCQTGQTLAIRAVDQYKLRLQHVASILAPTIDQISLLARTRQAISDDSWTCIKQISFDCLKLVEAVDAGGLKNTAETEAGASIRSMLKSLASIFWHRYVEIKSGNGSLDEAEYCIKTAIDMLQRSDVQGQLDGAMLQKIEHHILLLETTDRHEEAFDVCQQSLRKHHQLGSFFALRCLGAGEFVPSICGNLSGTKALSGTLQTYLRLSTKLSGPRASKIPYYDPGGSDEGQRLSVLMIQLCALTSCLSSESRGLRYTHSIRSLLQILLEICSDGKFPIERLYIQTMISLISLTNPSIIDRSLGGSTYDEHSWPHLPPQADSNSSLRGYWTNLSEQLSLYSALHGSDLDSSHIETIVADWLALVRGCRNLEQLQAKVFDTDSWCTQIDLLALYLEYHAVPSILLQVYRLAQLVNERTGADDTKASSLKIQIGTQLGHLGHPVWGMSLLQSSKPSFSKDLSSTRFHHEWSLAMSQLAYDSRDLSQCEKFLNQTYQSLEKYDSSVSPTEWMYTATAQVYSLKSRYASETGKMLDALLFARLSVKGFTRIWSMKERRYGNQVLQKVSAELDSNLSLSCAFNEVTIEEEKRPSKGPFHGSVFWSILPKFVDALLQLSCLLSDAGLFLDSKYYLEKAEGIVESAHSSQLARKCQLVRSQHMLLSGDINSICNLSRDWETSIASKYADLASIRRFCSMAAVYARARDLQTSNKLLARATHMSNELKSLDLRIEPGVFNDDDSLKDSLALLKIEDATVPSRKQARSQAEARKAAATAVKGQRKATTRRAGAQKDQKQSSASILQTEFQMELQKTTNLVLSGDLAGAQAHLQQTTEASIMSKDNLDRPILDADINMRLGLREMAAHPVFNVVSESTLCHPSVSASNTVTESNMNGTKVVRTRTKFEAKKSQVKQPKTGINGPEASIGQSLHLARVSIETTLQVASQRLSAVEVSRALQIFSKSLLTLTILPLQQPGEVVPSGLITYADAVPRNLARCRAFEAMQAERDLPKFSQPIGMLAQVPESAQPTKTLSSDEICNMTNFETEFVDMVPANWNIVTVSINDTRDELLVARLRCNEAPFVISVPLERHNAADHDETSFGFTEAIEELQDIIQDANTSSQDSRDQTTKADKTAWWNARMELDTRLRDLLQNIESIWFGGFRGIFSAQRPNLDQLSRFHESLQGGLDKHLPSRQNTGKGKHVERTTLNAHVLRLFVALGCPTMENDIDEPVLELLYLVVDILQFKGERNAYDEIDFDSLVIETLDALRQYHKLYRQSSVESEQQHTILILDKPLHSLPWESLPCLQGLSVSRLPSLLCLRQRVLQQRESRGIHRQDCKTNNYMKVRSDDGAFVLNPSGDLSNTQQHFEDSLQSLPGWVGLVKQPPAETDFQDYVENHGVFLYFGHGSGGQYIRSRTIRKLDRCAVTLLMGCSSGMLTEAGHFEPYGTPFDYMTAGSPALVANLWDVTDKDIDRFSQSVLEKWGLFDKGTPPGLMSPVKKGRKGKGKAQVVREVVEPVEETGPLSLDTAVARSRDKCILRYLNGAAPVMYGVPVLLDK